MADLDRSQARLRIVESLINRSDVASSRDPAILIERARAFEAYIFDDARSTPGDGAKRRPGRPPKQR